MTLSLSDDHSVGFTRAVFARRFREARVLVAPWNRSARFTLLLGFLCLFPAFSGSLWGQTASVTPSASTYSVAGGILTFSVSLAYTTQLSALGFQVGSIPAGWTYVSAGGAQPPAVTPAPGSTGNLEFAYTTVPAGPVNFTFALAYPVGLSGPQIFSGLVAIFRSGTQGVRQVPVANLVISPPAAGTPPLIIVQPADATVSLGENVTLTVSASGAGPFSYAWRKDGLILPAATTATLVLPAITAASVGSYVVEVTNAAGSVRSGPAVVALRSAVAPPLITSQPAGFSGDAGSPVVLRVVATGAAPLTYQWRKDGVVIPGATGATLALTGALVESGSYVVTVGGPGGSTNSNPAVVQLTTVAEQITITRQPAGMTLAAGESASLAVEVVGHGRFSYQWFKDGAVLAGATEPELRFSSANRATGGEYFVEVKAGRTTVRSLVARVIVNDQPIAPRIVRQPAAAIALLGGSALFSVEAYGNPAPSYQWRRNGTALAGATAASLNLHNLQAVDGGLVDVIVSNTNGRVLSAAVPLSVTTSPQAPVFLRQPAGSAAVGGRTITLTALAVGVPAPTYQWHFEGVALTGATMPTLTLSNLTSSQSGRYTLVAVNQAGSATSAEAVVTVLGRNCAGTYSGTFGHGGRFALHVRSDHTGTLLGFDPSNKTVFLQPEVTVGREGRLRIVAPAQTRLGDSSVATAAEFTWEGEISEAGQLSAIMTSGGEWSLTGLREREAEAGPAVAGIYVANAEGYAGVATCIVGSYGLVTTVLQSGFAMDGAVATLDAHGKATTRTALGHKELAMELSAATSLITLTETGTGGGIYRGTSDTAVGRAEQRLLNISARTTAGMRGEPAIVGFVLGGLEAKTLLIRAVGPSLAGFGVTSGLARPALTLVRDNVEIAANSGWKERGDSSGIATAATRAGAFPLGAESADSALLVTLPPGSYSAVVTAADGKAGVGLVEVYDLSGGTADQRLSNLSTRALVGGADATLIAGIVVGGSVPKRMLVRAVGPGLARFRVSGVLERPHLTLFRGSEVLARNNGWGSSDDAVEIARVSTRVGAFSLATDSADAALLISLPPGAYTAQVTGENGAAGVALVEAYEVL